jgi:hypothetical protein
MGGSGSPDVLRFLAATIGLIVGPVIGAVLIGLIQLSLYKLFLKLKWIGAEDIPMFPILVMRGMFVILAVIAAVVFYLRFGLKEPGFVAPTATESGAGQQR